MTFRSCVVAGLILAHLIWLAGCATRPHSSARLPRPPQRASLAPPPAPPLAKDRQGAHHLTGDYAGYPALERFIERMARRHGYSREYLYDLFSQVRRKQWTLDYLSRDSGRRGPPRPGSWSRYRAKFLTEKHIAAGASFWNRHAEALERASRHYGVDPEYILGILGVETFYGNNLGNHRVIDALTTLAFDYPRRSAYFTQELENYLVMTQREGIDPTEPLGSYAGAMGLGQFMPSSFLRFAVDFDGDGRRDLWDATDAIGSIANYFASHGWRPGEPVAAPAIVTRAAARGLETGLDARYPLAVLADYGIRPVLDHPAESVRLLRLSTDAGDEYWVGYDNFYVITRYNHSVHYAMAVHQLAEAVRQRYQELASARL